jgi:hypothetical protein
MHCEYLEISRIANTDMWNNTSVVWGEPMGSKKNVVREAKLSKSPCTYPQKCSRDQRLRQYLLQILMVGFNFITERLHFNSINTECITKTTVLLDLFVFI